MRVVAMFRVSTEKQANEGASLDAQQRKFRELAANSGWTTVEEFRGCESAMHAATERQVLQQVLECIRQEAPDALYVHEQSRLSRGDPLEVALLLRELTERNVKVIVGGEVRDLSSIDGRFMVGIQSLVDRAEGERIRERSLRGRRERARQGKWNCGQAPLGYRNPPPGDPRRGTLVIEPAEAEVVRQVFRWASAGVSLPEIGRRLRQRGVKTKRGGSWSSSVVRKILRNRAYLGHQLSGVWVRPKGTRSARFRPDNEHAILVENAHPPIVPLELWNKVRARAKAPCTQRPNLLTGMLHLDGLKYCGDRSRGVKIYRAPKGIRKRPWLDAEITDQTAWQAFVSIATKPELIDQLNRATSSRGESVSRIAQQVRGIEALLKKLESRLDRLIEMRADGEIGRDVFAVKSDEVRRQIRLRRDSLIELANAKEAANGSTSDQLVRAIQAIVAGARKLTVPQRRAALASIVRRIDVAATRSAEHQPRRTTGRFLSGGAPRWRPAEFTFHLAGSGDRVGQLGTTSWSWAGRRGSGPLRFRRRSRRCPAARRSEPD